jgi:hypothetical protein
MCRCCSWTVEHLKQLELSTSMAVDTKILWLRVRIIQLLPTTPLGEFRWVASGSFTLRCRSQGTHQGHGGKLDRCPAGFKLT